MTPSRTLLAVAVFAVLLAACGKAQESASEALAEQALEAQTGAEVELDTEDGVSTVTMQTEEGQLQHSVGENVPLPENFPRDVVLPDDYTVVSVMKMGPTQSVVLRSRETMATLYDHYKTGQTDRGWKETMSMQGAEGASLGFEKGKRGVLVNLRPDIEGQTVVSLSLQAP
jgi:hypothetical protein